MLLVLVWCEKAEGWQQVGGGSRRMLTALRPRPRLLSGPVLTLRATTDAVTAAPSSTSTPVMTDYDAQAITVLKGLEPVRKRPGMYIGSTGIKGLHHLVFEVVDNSVDEALAGYCTDITVMLHGDNVVTVTDNGRGIPCAVHPTTGKSTLETVLCVLHAGGKFGGDQSGYKVSGGLHGVGISVVNALSEELHVEVVRDGQYHDMKFSRGEPQTEMRQRVALPHEHRGTRVTFKPDASIFKTTTVFELDRLTERLNELAYLNAGLTIRLIDARNPHSTAHEDSKNAEGSSEGEEESSSGKTKAVELVFKHDGGISELIQSLCESKTSLHPEKDIITIKEERKGIVVDIAMKWSKDMYSEALSGFANGIRTSDGGSHLDGLKSAVTKTVNAFAKKVS